MTNRMTQRSLTSLIVRETQLKTTVEYHLGGLKWKIQKTPRLDEEVEHPEETHTWLVGTQNGADTLEKLVVSNQMRCIVLTIAVSVKLLVQHLLTLVTNSKCREGTLRITRGHGYLVVFLFGVGQTRLKPVSSPHSRRSRQEGPNLLGTRDLFCWRQFFHRLGWGDGFGMIQEHYKYQLVLGVWLGEPEQVSHYGKLREDLYFTS